MARTDTPPGDPQQSAAPAPSPRRQETRARLLDAAAEVFAEDGLQGASVEAICARAGFTRGAFYSNFSSKEQLFLALLDRAYAERTADLRARTQELLPMLDAQSCPITSEEAARYVSEFFGPTGDEAMWLVLETEFMLLALRDDSHPRGFTDFIGRFRTELAQIVEEIVHVAGRRFTMPVERAMPILGGIYDRAFRITAIEGHDAPEGLGELGDRIAELLFAITEEVDPGGTARERCAGIGSAIPNRTP